MDPRFFRKFADLVESAEQDQPVQLTEGAIMNLLRPLAMKFVNLVGPAAMQDIVAQVRQVTGGDLTPNKLNAVKVAQAFGLERKDMAPPVAEGIAGNWQGKLIQLAYGSGLAGSAATIYTFFGDAVHGAASSFAAAIGLILLMAIGAFLGDEAGQVGAMGKFGNTGTDTTRGSNSPMRR